METAEQLNGMEAQTPKPKRGRPPKQAASASSPKKKRRKRQSAKTISFEMLCGAAGLIAHLETAIGDDPKCDKLLKQLEQHIQAKLLQNPIQLFARLAQPLAPQATHTERGEMRREIQSPVSPHKPEPVRTVGPESPVLSMTDIDLFIAEETPGRYYTYQLGPRDVPLLILSREEYGALRSQIIEQSGDLEAFKRELSQTVPDEQLIPFFQAAMAYYRGVVIRIP